MNHSPVFILEYVATNVVIPKIGISLEWGTKGEDDNDDDDDDDGNVEVIDEMPSAHSYRISCLNHGRPKHFWLPGRPSWYLVLENAIHCLSSS